MSRQIQSEVLVSGEAQFTSWGTFIGRPLKSTGQPVSKRLAQRLARYAEQRLTDAGFGAAIQGWECRVEAVGDACDGPEDRTYHVCFYNQNGGYIGTEGVFVQNGKPVIDHGLCIGADI